MTSVEMWTDDFKSGVIYRALRIVCDPPLTFISSLYAWEPPPLRSAACSIGIFLLVWALLPIVLFDLSTYGTMMRDQALWDCCEHAASVVDLQALFQQTEKVLRSAQELYEEALQLYHTTWTFWNGPAAAYDAQEGLRRSVEVRDGLVDTLQVIERKIGAIHGWGSDVFLKELVELFENGIWACFGLAGDAVELNLHFSTMDVDLESEKAWGWAQFWEHPMHFFLITALPWATQRFLYLCFGPIFLLFFVSFKLPYLVFDFAPLGVGA